MMPCSCTASRLGDLLRDRQRVGECDRTTRDAIGERRPLDQFHDERADAVRFFQPVDVRDVGMVQRFERLRLALEAGDALRIAGERLGQDLDRHVAIELRVARAIHFAHAAAVERALRGAADCKGPGEAAGDSVAGRALI